MLVKREKWDHAVWLVSTHMAEDRGSLPHEERWAAVESLRSFEQDPSRDTNSPRLKALLSAHGVI